MTGERPSPAADAVGPVAWEATVNGAGVCLTAAPDRRLLDILRDDLGLTGAKEGCSVGRCGACTVLVDGRPRIACLTLAYQVAGATVTTIEGLATGEVLHPVQAAFVAAGAFQCGYCTAGMVLATVAALEADPTATPEALETALVGNLCRCSGYTGVRRALASLAAGDTETAAPVAEEPAAFAAQDPAAPAAASPAKTEPV